jgi:peptide subunit release factor 1 (eRF1)
MAKSTILPSSSASLLKLSKIQGDDRCVMTVYFPGSQAHNKKIPAELPDLPASLLRTDSLTRDEVEHRLRSIELWRAEAPKVSLPPALGWVGVVSWLTEEVAFMQLPSTLDSAAYLDNSPFLLPAGRMLDDLEAYAVLYADHARATIYLSALGKLAEEDRLRGDIKNHVRKGGWSQQRYERRRDKEIHRYCQALVDKLKEVVESEGLRRIVLTGDRILLNELEKRMEPDLLKKVVCHLALEGKKDSREIFQETLSAAAEEERREERWLRDSILKEYAAGGRAVIGSADTLAALKEKRVRWLLIGPMEGVDFWRCGSCGVCGLGRSPTCPDCGKSTYAQSAANEFTDLAYTGRSRVEFVSGDLAKIGGVGALLRW